MKLSEDLGAKGIVTKAVLFVVMLMSAVALNLMHAELWMEVFTLVLIIWSSARIYYFMFYVIEKYVDSEFRFSSVYAFLKYVLRKARES